MTTMSQSTIKLVSSSATIKSSDAIDDGVSKLGTGGVSPHVIGPDFAVLDDGMDGLCDDVGVAVKLHVAQQVSGGKQHGCRVGGVPSNSTWKF